MSKRGRPSYLDKKKAARLKWSRNANAAKAALDVLFAEYR